MTENSASDNTKSPQTLLEPQVIAVCGSPGAGKTTVARAIARRLGLVLLSRDEVKNGLGLTCGYEPEFHLAGGPYSQQAEAVLTDLAWGLAEARVSFVLETSVLSKELLDGLQVLAVHVTARPEVIDARLQARDDHQLADQFRRGEMPAKVFAPPDWVETVVVIDTSDQEAPDIDAVTSRFGPGPRRTG